MALADSKKVHQAVLKAKGLCEQIIDTDDELQALKADWTANVQAAWTAWMASPEAPTASSLINPGLLAKINAVINQHSALRVAIQTELTELKAVE